MRDIYTITPSTGIQDSLAFWIPHRGFRILGNGFQIFVNATWIPDSNRQRNSGFLELYSRFQDPGFRIPIVSGILDSQSCIPDSRKAKDSGFHKTKMSRILESGFLYMGRQEGTMMANCKLKAKDEPKRFFLCLILPFLSLIFQNSSK